MADTSGTRVEAVVLVRAEEVAVQSVKVAPPGPGEIQVRTDLSAVSVGTETWILRNRFTWSPTPFPCVPGYQRVGRVTAVGPGVHGWQVGDRVMTVTGEGFGEVMSFWGTHVALANTAVDFAFHLPDRVDDVDASAAVMVQVGYNAASRAVLNPGDWVVVYGDGMIGQSAAQAARALGARVILVGHRDERLDLARRHSADVVINSHSTSVAAAVRQHTGQPTVAAILDSVQTVSAQQQYMELLERGKGQIVYCGFTPTDAWANIALLQQQELTTHFVSGWTRERMQATFSLMASGKLSFKPLVTHAQPYQRAPDLYRMMLDKSEPFLGVTFDWKDATS